MRLEDLLPYVSVRAGGMSYFWGAIL
jgi:hypothetical protein